MTITGIGVHYTPDQASQDSRKEPRFESAGIGDLKIFYSATVRLSATIIDVSKSGLRIEVDKPLQSGTAVELSFGDSVVMGAVGNCAPRGPDRYRVGILTRRVIESPLRLRHLSDADHLPYVLNDVLTEAQRYYYTQHLELCSDCEQSVERTREALNTPG